MTSNHYIKDSSGNYTFNESVHPQVIIDLAKSLLEKRLVDETLTSPQTTRDFLKVRLRSYEHEIFGVIFLDNRHRVITFEEMFRGTIDGCSVHPREVVKAALAHNAAAVIFAHNHPSGVAEPSQADRQITDRLRDALQMVDIRVLDHFIVGDGEVTSFSERGLI